VRSFVHLLEGHKLPITTLPSLKELVNGKVGVKQIRPLAIEDLLPRSQVALSADNVRRLVKGKRVLVTGAGGSIGSELCRQIASFGPSDLILYERYENSLYAIENDLRDRAVVARVHSVIGDVTDVARVQRVFAEHRPHLVFHAAAHKHVPLMEANPCEAIKNNVVGTQVVAATAREYGAERFLLISTDKAANPSSVMGASKRVAELIVQALGADSPGTRFVTVRFGNVLGSNGSVIPRMIDQIRTGGPVTVTHPEIRRYFMLIPEAVQLVLQAAALAHDREIFVLDMGEQLRVLDVARNLIRLSGFVPEEEIPITIIGLRPGEKLVEELAGYGEVLESSDVDKVFIVRRTEKLDAARLSAEVPSLVEMAVLGQASEVLAGLQRIVPSFRPPQLSVGQRPQASVRAVGRA
jgi:FlaA1/EpsC-like NDP-sugar epimerase